MEHRTGQLFPPVGFMVKKMRLPSRDLAWFYNRGGMTEH